MKLYFSITKQLVLLRNLFLLLAFYGRAILFCEIGAFVFTVYCRNEIFYRFCASLKFHYFTRVEQLTELTCVDHPQNINRFKAVYVFLSCYYNTRYLVSCFTSSHIPLPSVLTLFAGSNWQEREVWDMFGIMFIGHPDLRRILTDYGFLGHPLRKDFPLSGFVEVYFNDMAQLVAYQSISLAQEFRDFGKCQNPWQIS